MKLRGKTRKEHNELSRAVEMRQRKDLAGSMAKHDDLRDLQGVLRILAEKIGMWNRGEK